MNSRFSNYIAHQASGSSSLGTISMALRTVVKQQATISSSSMNVSCHLTHLFSLEEHVTTVVLIAYCIICSMLRETKFDIIDGVTKFDCDMTGHNIAIS